MSRAVSLPSALGEAGARAHARIAVLLDDMGTSIARLVGEAIDALAAVPVSAEGRDALESLATFVAWRDA